MGNERGNLRCYKICSVHSLVVKRIFSIIASILLLASPGVVFAADESCSEDTVCECTDADGTAISIPDDSISDGDACSDECAGRDSVSFALYCGDEETPLDSGDVPSGDAEATTEEAETPSIPALNVPIPGLDLSGSVQVDDQGNIETNMIGLYVNAVFFLRNHTCVNLRRTHVYDCRLSIHDGRWR